MILINLFVLFPLFREQKQPLMSGRSSDFPLALMPSRRKRCFCFSQWLKVYLSRRLEGSQQRVCPGFPPDSLLIPPGKRSHRKPTACKSSIKKQTDKVKWGIYFCKIFHPPHISKQTTEKVQKLTARMGILFSFARKLLRVKVEMVKSKTENTWRKIEKPLVRSLISSANHVISSGDYVIGTADYVITTAD